MNMDKRIINSFHRIKFTNRIFLEMAHKIIRKGNPGNFEVYNIKKEYMLS